MFDEFKNFDIAKRSDSELKFLIRQTLPVLLQACLKLLNEKDKSKQSPCDNCEKQESCEGVCKLLESKLSGKNVSSYPQIKNYGSLLENIADFNEEHSNKFDYDYLRVIDRIRSDDLFTLYKNCSILFTKCEWRVVTLKVRDGLTFKKISQIIGIAPSTASDTFHRAKRRMEKYYKKLRHVKKRKST